MFNLLFCFFFLFFSVYSIQAKRLYHFAFYFLSFFYGDILNETHNSISNAWAFARAVHLQFSTLIFHTFCHSLSVSKAQTELHLLWAFFRWLAWARRTNFLLRTLYGEKFFYELLFVQTMSTSIKLFSRGGFILLLTHAA